jgi:uncharacterized protein YbjT (DUF2867 family)
MSKIRRIAVFGATGMLGRPVTEQLISAGFEVRICARDIKKAKDMFGDKVEYFLCDLIDKDAVNKAIEGVDAVYCNLSVKPNEKEGDFHPEREGLKNIIESAKRAKVKRIGYISSIIARDYKGNDWWVMRLKKEAINLVKNSGIPYCIFYPSSFMENLIYGFIRGDRITVAGKSVYKNWWIAGEDYGKQVAHSFQILGDNESRDYTVQGPESLFTEEAVDIFIRHYKKRKLKKVKVPLWLLRIIGLFNPQAFYAYKILSIINSVPEPFMSQQTWDELGKPEITIRTFAEKLNAM